MNKLQKLNLKKIKIANVNYLNAIRGGETETCMSTVCETHEPCVSNNPTACECPSDTITGYDCTITVNDIPASQRCNTTLPSKVKN